MRHVTNPVLDCHNIYWIGGSPCSGKSSIAEKLAARHDLRLIHTDDFLVHQMRQADPDRHPVMYNSPRKPGMKFG